MGQNVDLQRTEFSRVFLHEGGAGPAVAPAYMGLWKAGAVSWEQGGITSVRVPSRDSYGKFDVVDRIQEEPGDPEMTIMARMTMDRSRLLKLVRTGCAIDLKVHVGKCGNPQDHNAGWEKIFVLESAQPTSYGTEDLGALGADERAMVNEEVPFTGLDLYDIGKVSFSKQAEALIAREVMGVWVCDSVTCGNCGRTSDGCQVVLAVVSPSVGSPGLYAEVIYTENGGATWNESPIASMSVSDVPDGILCVGNYVVVLDSAGASLHYTELADLLDGTAVWAEVTTGFTAAKGPNAAWSNSPTETWLAGDGGYIYEATDPTSSVTAQDEGSNTTQDLLAIHGYDANNIVAVGASNAVLRTQNGGQTWAAVTGPAVGVNLNTVAMLTKDIWFVGTAGGRLYYTTDGGTSWTEKAFSGSGAGSVRSVVFASKMVGYMAHSTAAPAGRIFRTIDGGYSWYLLPEGAGTIPANDYIRSLATCEDPNTIFGGGLADDASDGILLKGTSPTS